MAEEITNAGCQIGNAQQRGRLERPARLTIVARSKPRPAHGAKILSCLFDPPTQSFAQTGRVGRRFGNRFGDERNRSRCHRATGTGTRCAELPDRPLYRRVKRHRLNHRAAARQDRGEVAGSPTTRTSPKPTVLAKGAPERRRNAGRPRNIRQRKAKAADPARQRVSGTASPRNRPIGELPKRRRRRGSSAAPRLVLVSLPGHATGIASIHTNGTIPRSRVSVRVDQRSGTTVVIHLGNGATLAQPRHAQQQEPSARECPETSQVIHAHKLPCPPTAQRRYPTIGKS